MQVRGMSPRAPKKEIRAVIAQAQAELVSLGHPTTTLEDLFLKIVRESEEPGPRVVAEQMRSAAK